jgi:hypothetical protein
MGSVTSYDVTKSRKKRHQLPNFSSDEVTSDGVDDSEEEKISTEHSSSEKNARNHDNRDNKMQRKTTNPEKTYPKPKPRSVQSKMSTGTSSNMSSSKSNSSNSVIEPSFTKETGKDIDKSSKSSTPKSPHLTSVTKIHESAQPVSQTYDASNSSGTNAKQMQTINKFNGEDISDKRKDNVSKNNSFVIDNIIDENTEGNRNVQMKGQLSRSKSTVDLDGGANSNPGLR